MPNVAAPLQVRSGLKRSQQRTGIGVGIAHVYVMTSGTNDLALPRRVMRHHGQPTCQRLDEDDAVYFVDGG